MSLYKNQPQGVRSRRVAEQIHRKLAEYFLSGKLYIPEFEGLYIGVAHVDVTPDLKHAKVHLFLPEDCPKEVILRICNTKAQVFVQDAIKKLGLRFTPSLEFFEDTFQRHAMTIDAMLDEVNGVEKRSKTDE